MRHPPAIALQDKFVGTSWALYKVSLSGIFLTITLKKEGINSCELTDDPEKMT